MSRSENRHFTKKWKERRKDHDGDKCNSSKCPICTPHKRYGGNSGKFDKRKHIIEKINLKERE